MAKSPMPPEKKPNPFAVKGKKPPNGKKPKGAKMHYRPL